MKNKIAFIFMFLFGVIQLSDQPALGAELLTNAAHFADAPKWLTAGRINRLVDHIQAKLEWDIHRAEVTWYDDQKKFEQMHAMGPLVLAISKKKDNSIHLGPNVTEKNFDEIFTHELVHIISFQKYKEAIPKWLEEGLANHLSKSSKVDYAWIAKKPFPSDVHELTHPFKGSEDHIRYHYAASQALAELIDKKCGFRTLLQLSVNRKMEDYIDTYCEIHDLNAAFKKWVQNQVN